MCLFPLPNNNIKSKAYQKGIVEFACGACPECLRKRGNIWVLRAVHESKLHQYNCMVTLTYDTFKYDNRNGSSVEENPVDPDIVVCKRHIQLFIKRLRKHFSGSKIKYMCGAEYGSTTHRAHYHLVLFGVNFSDAYFYKRSKRGNPIYMSNTLTDLWGHGICTIDCLQVKSSVSRYCTKYCSKNRQDGSFMLFSQKLGFQSLLDNFNARSYFVDGKEFSIPRYIWNYYIENKYSDNPVPFTSRYYNLLDGKKKDLPEFSPEWLADYTKYVDNCKARKEFFRLRDNDPVYIEYLKYWSEKGKMFEQNTLSPRVRIYNLDSRKYHNYRIKALECLDARKNAPVPAPGSKCVSAYYHKLNEWRLMFHVDYENLALLVSCPNSASDTKPGCIPFNKIKLSGKSVVNGQKLRFCDLILLPDDEVIPFDFCKSQNNFVNIQISLDI